MLLRSTTLKTLRDQRWPALLWGGALAAATALNAAAWTSAYPDAAARHTLATQVGSGSLKQLQVIYGTPHHLDQIGGWIEWRVLAIVPLLLGLFMVLAATGETRSQEMRGDLELTLAASHSRARVFAEQAAGLLLALTVACALIWVGLLLCGPAARSSGITPLHALLAAVNVLVASAIFGAFALLVAQFAHTRRVAATVAAAVMFVAYFWNTIGQTNGDLEGLRYLSPLALYSNSTPLSDGRVDAGALAGLVLIALALTVAAGWLFVRRDIRGTTPLRLGALGRRGPDRARSTWLLGSVFGRALRDSLGGALAWGLALGAYAALMAAITPGLVAAVRDQQNAQQMLSRLGSGSAITDAGLLSFALFGIVSVLAAACAVTLASSWPAEQGDGRLSMDLAAPIARRRYYLERLAATLVAVAIAVLLMGVAFAVAGALAGVHVDAGRALAAVLLLAPVAAVVVAFAFALAAGSNTNVVGVTGIAVGVSFLLELLAPLLHLPGAVALLSIFHLYGRPLLDGVDIGGLLALAALVVAFALAGMLAFDRKSIAH